VSCRPRPAMLAVAGCASGSSPLGQGDAPNVPVDAKQIDAPIQPHPDAFVPLTDAFVPQDAPADMMTDASTADAACVPMVTQLLANPALDLTPMGTNWQQTPIDPTFPPITDQDGPAEQSAPYKMWLGGFAAGDLGMTTVTDVVYQDVTVPANTTQLVLSYYYIVGTQEDPAATIAFDTASIAFTQTNGTQIVQANSFSNLTPVATWTLATFTVPQNLSGQTIRLRLTSSNDVSFGSNFFFDSFALNATHCP
jgi:hypothetical protein